MRVIETKVYQFSELSDKAKEKAREWRRDGGLDYDWWESVYDWKKEAIGDAGFDIDRIYFSGFWSQGDGAMFEYSGISNELKESFINSLNLSPMRKDWLRNNVYANAVGIHMGHYYHENSCIHTIYWQVDNGDLHYSTLFYQWIESFAADFEEYVIDLYKDLCIDLYRALEAEYDYLNSDGVIDEIIVANEYEFKEDGSRF